MSSRPIDRSSVNKPMAAADVAATLGISMARLQRLCRCLRINTLTRLTSEQIDQIDTAHRIVRAEAE